MMLRMRVEKNNEHRRILAVVVVCMYAVCQKSTAKYPTLQHIYVSLSLLYAFSNISSECRAYFNFKPESQLNQLFCN